MSPRVLFPLLALANFVVGGAAIIAVGVLPQIATEFTLDKADAGWLMTVYALTYAVSSPVLVALTGRRDRAHVLISGLGVLLAGLALAAWSPSFAVLLASRAVMAVGSGLITPVATGVVVALVAPEQRGRSLATVFGGLTLAQAFAVPAGAWAAQHTDWRVAFAVLAGLALVAAITLFAVAPRRLPARPASLATLGSVLSTPRLVFAVGFILFFFTGVMALFTYITPFLAERAGVTGAGLTAMLVVFGFGAIAGNALGGRLTDRLGPTRTLLLLVGVEVVLLPVITLSSLPVYGLAAVILAWSIVTWSIHVPQQARLSALDPEKAPVLISLHAAALYCGFSLGSVLGGQVLRAASYDALGPVAAAMMLLSLGTLAIVALLRAPSPLAGERVEVRGPVPTVEE